MTSSTKLRAVGADGPPRAGDSLGFPSKHHSAPGAGGTVPAGGGALAPLVAKGALAPLVAKGAMAPLVAKGALAPLVMEFLDRSILRERRMEALWKRAGRGPFPEDLREELLFESYEDREHARILRRHRATMARALGIERRAPGSRATKVGRTFSPAAALAEALSLKAASRAEYAGMVRFLEDRFLRKFVDVLAGAEDQALPRLLARAGEYGIRPRPPEPHRAALLRPVSPLLQGTGYAASSVA